MILINIVRIVVTKVQLQNSSSSMTETAHVKKAVRATLILFPLLGITNLLFFMNPKNGTHDKIYMLFNASMQSSQVHTTYFPSRQATQIYEVYANKKESETIA